MHNNPTTEGQVPLERVEIHFAEDWSKVTKVSIKAEKVAKINKWPEDNMQFDPAKFPGFIAFLLACVKAANSGMKVGGIVLDGAPATTFYSLNKDSDNAKKWVTHLLIFPGSKKPAIIGSFNISRNRAHGSVEVRLHQPFEVVACTDNLASNFPRAEDALKKIFNQLKSKHSGNNSAISIPLHQKLYNLPPARCHKFIVRPKIEQPLLEALRSEKSVVWVYGEEGAGKAETLRHVLLEHLPQLPYEVAWVDIRKGKTGEVLDASQILAELGRQLGLDKLLPKNNPDMVLAAQDLSRHGVLLVIQHYEALKDPAIFNWLTSLQPSKAVVISCQSPQKEQVDLSHRVKVTTMSDVEREEFLKLRLETDNSNPLVLSASDKKEIFDVAGANPQRIDKAISMLQNGFGLVDLHSPRYINEIVPASYKDLADHSQICLLALSLFPFGAYSNEITKIAKLTEDEVEVALSPLRGFVEMCRDNSNDISRWQLADQGTGNWLREHHKDDSDFKAMKDRWYRHFEEMADDICCCWDDLDKLSTLDIPGRAETVIYVLGQAMNEKRYKSAIHIGCGCRYWQYVRGDWMGKTSPIQIWEDAARADRNDSELFDALVYQLNIRAKQARHSATALEDAKILEGKIQSLLHSVRPVKGSKDRYLHAISLLDLARGPKYFAKAEARWKKCLKGRLASHEKSAMQRWLAVCLREQNNPKKRNEARTILEKHLKYVEGKFERSALMAHLNLTEMDLEDKEIKLAGSRLEQIKKRIEASKDRSFLADHEFFTAMYLMASDKCADAATAFERARAHYDRLGKDARVSEIDNVLSKLG